MPRPSGKLIYKKFLLPPITLLFASLLITAPRLAQAAASAEVTGDTDQDMCCVCEVFDSLPNNAPYCIDPVTKKNICGNICLPSEYKCRDGKKNSSDINEGPTRGTMCQECTLKNVGYKAPLNFDEIYTKNLANTTNTKNPFTVAWQMGSVYVKSIQDFNSSYSSGGGLTCGSGQKCQCNPGKCQYQTVCPQSKAALAPVNEFHPPTLNIPIPGLAEFTMPATKPGDFTYFPWLAQYINALYKFAISLSGIIATMMVMVGGFVWMTSGGSSDRVSSAKNYILSAVIGLVLALGSYFILNVINPQLTQLASIGSSVITASPGGSSGGISKPWSGDKNFETYDKELANAAKLNGIDCTFAKAIMLIESGGNPKAVSSSKACGLTQMLPSTANSIKNLIPAGIDDGDKKKIKEQTGIEYNQIIAGKDNITCETLKSSPTLAIYLQTTYLKTATKENVNCEYQKKTGTKKGSRVEGMILTAAAYNGGPRANCWSNACPGQTWWECPLNKGYRETRNYVLSMLATYNNLLKPRDKGENWGCDTSKLPAK